jgi:precorrin-2 dehydrogenase/sirohydrochlorin ferrochelatase
MIPIYVDPRAARVLLVGRGPLFARRLAWLRGLGASPRAFTDQPAAALGVQSAERLAGPDDFAPGQIVWIAGLEADEAEGLASAARAAGALLNVEDRPRLCDFHTPAVLRRGRLTLAAGTGGASPAAARFARERLEAHFPPEWEEALEEIADARRALRARDASFETLAADARARLSRRGLI